MDNIWLIILAGSLTALCLIIFKIRLRWLRYTLINVALAAIVLFAANQIGLFGSYAIPINVVTVGTVGLLGIPGLVLLMSIKLVLV